MTYKVKIKGLPHSYKKPFFCPHCRRISSTLDDSYFEGYGICATCFVCHVDERSKPDIDLSEYAPFGGLFEGMTREEIDVLFLNNQK